MSRGHVLEIFSSWRRCALCLLDQQRRERSRQDFSSPRMHCGRCNAVGAQSLRDPNVLSRIGPDASRARPPIDIQSAVKIDRHVGWHSSCGELLAARCQKRVMGAPCPECASGRRRLRRAEWPISRPGSTGELCCVSLATTFARAASPLASSLTCDRQAAGWLTRMREFVTYARQRRSLEALTHLVRKSEGMWSSGTCCVAMRPAFSRA